MKKGILFFLLLSAFGVNAQSLKDALYGGKLKMDSNSVIRKTDDIKSKIDTTTKKKTEPEKPKETVQESLKTNAPDSLKQSSIEPVVNTTPANENAVAAKSNNKIWKEYIDSITGILKTEVLPSKKIKKETYFLYVEYEIGTDGKVEILNVVANPENSFLADNAKSQLISYSPQLVPVLDSNNKPRKVKRKYNFSITKD